MNSAELSDRVAAEAHFAGAAGLEERGSCLLIYAPANLSDAVLRALGKNEKGSPPAQGAAADQDKPGPLRILLAEDGLVNQKLAVALLKKRKSVKHPHPYQLLIEKKSIRSSLPTLMNLWIAYRA